MDLNKYLGLKVKIVLANNNYYYVGKVVYADDNSLEILDVKGQRVSLSENAILTIQEVGK